MMRPAAVSIEACVDTLESALLAAAGGADRVELCADLSDAGTTPSHGTLALALERLSIPVFPIIRPRGGGFACTSDEASVILADLRHARDLGARGAVIGALTPEGAIDRELVGMLRRETPGMALTFHRAFDIGGNPFAALETLIELGVDRVLTSGQAQTAWEGRYLLAELVRAARGRIVVMAGGGVNEEHAAELVRITGVTELHVRAATLRRDVGADPAIALRKAPPRDELARGVTDPRRIAAIRDTLSG